MIISYKVKVIYFSKFEFCENSKLNFLFNLENPDPIPRLSTIKKLITALPQSHKQLLIRLFKFLLEVAQYSEVNIFIFWNFFLFLKFITIFSNLSFFYFFNFVM